MDKNSPFTPEAVLQYAQKEASDRLNESPGKGMYFALNPVTSSVYSELRRSNNWVLLALKIPRNTLFLNLNRDHLLNLKISKKERHWLQEQGCDGFFDGSACGLNAYAKTAGVSGYFYYWSKASFSFCEPDPNLNETALDLRDSSLIRPANLTFFDLNSENETQNKPFLSLLNSLFKFYSGEMTFVAEAAPWKAEKLNPVDPSTLRDFAQHSLIGACK